MDALKVLWLDLRIHKTTNGVFTFLTDYCKIYHTQSTSQIKVFVQQYEPHAIIFDFDYPNELDLKTLQKTTRDYPTRPIVMLTEYHSEALAIWAFRSRVWDYLIKPIHNGYLAECITALSTHTSQNTPPGQNNFMDHTLPPLPKELQFPSNPPKHSITNSAVNFVRTHYPNKIALQKVAHLCGMSQFNFSRTFKRDQGICFQKFLIRYRIGKAQKLLKHPHAQVSDVALAVGFLDLSNFCRTFKRIVGLTANGYRRQYAKNRVE